MGQSYTSLSTSNTDGWLFVYSAQDSPTGFLFVLLHGWICFDVDTPRECLFLHHRDLYGLRSIIGLHKYSRLAELSISACHLDTPLQLIIFLISRSACSFSIVNTFIAGESLMGLSALMPSLKKPSITSSLPEGILTHCPRPSLRRVQDFYPTEYCINIWGIIPSIMPNKVLSGWLNPSNPHTNQRHLLLELSGARLNGECFYLNWKTFSSLLSTITGKGNAETGSMIWTWVWCKIFLDGGNAEWYALNHDLGIELVPCSLLRLSHRFLFWAGDTPVAPLSLYQPGYIESLPITPNNYQAHAT